MSKPLRSLLKVIVLGDCGVGKTSLVNQYPSRCITFSFYVGVGCKRGENMFSKYVLEMKNMMAKVLREQYKATIGADFATKELEIDERVVTLQIWDTAGQERFHSLGVAFYRGADCCILLYDVYVPKSFETLQHWHEEFIKQADLTEPEKFPFVLIGNKVDLEYGSIETVSEKKAKEWCACRGNIQNFMTSAKEDYNVDAAFLCAAQLALANEDDQNIWQPSVDEEMLLIVSSKEYQSLDQEVNSKEEGVHVN